MIYYICEGTEEVNQVHRLNRQGEKSTGKMRLEIFSTIHAKTFNSYV